MFLIDCWTNIHNKYINPECHQEHIAEHSTVKCLLRIVENSDKILLKSGRGDAALRVDPCEREGEPPLHLVRALLTPASAMLTSGSSGKIRHNCHKLSRTMRLH